MKKTYTESHIDVITFPENVYTGNSLSVVIGEDDQWGPIV